VSALFFFHREDREAREVFFFKRTFAPFAIFAVDPQAAA